MVNDDFFRHVAFFCSFFFDLLFVSFAFLFLMIVISFLFASNKISIFDGFRLVRWLRFDLVCSSFATSRAPSLFPFPFLTFYPPLFDLVLRQSSPDKPHNSFHSIDFGFRNRQFVCALKKCVEMNELRKLTHFT